MKYSSTNKPLECILTESRCYNRSSKMKVKGVLWHSTAAPNTTIRRYVQPSKNDPKYDELMALIGKNAYNNDWNDPNLKVCVHAFIGTLKDGTVTSVQTLPWDLACYGCGSGSRGSCNDGWIQFEICEDSLTSKSYFDDIYKEACELTAYLCKLYDLDPMAMTTYNGYEIPVVLCHKDSNDYKMGSNHGDVMHWFKKYNKTMDDVRRDVAKLMGQTSATAPAPTPVTPTPSTPVNFKKGDIVKLISNATYYNGKSIPSWIRNLEWIVKEEPKGDRVVIDKSTNGKYSIMSPVNAKNLVLVKRDNENIIISTPTPAPTPTPGKIVEGSLVKIAEGAVYTNNKSIPNWIRNIHWYVKSINGNRVVIDKSEDGKYSIMSALDIKYLSLVGAPVQNQPEVQKPVVEEFKPYIITVTASLLNYRSGPGSSYSVKGQIKKGGAYTIIEEKNGWGKLKSGAGWIALEYTKKI